LFVPFKPRLSWPTGAVWVGKLPAEVSRFCAAAIADCAGLGSPGLGYLLTTLEAGGVRSFRACTSDSIGMSGVSVVSVDVSDVPFNANGEGLNVPFNANGEGLEVGWLKPDAAPSTLGTEGLLESERGSVDCA
jgi:hypothetical protein